MTTSTDTRYDQAQAALAACDQEHVLRYYDELDEAQREQLLGQIESVDWPAVARLIQTHVKTEPELHLPANLEPAPWYPVRPDDALLDKYVAAGRRGEELLRAGKVAAFVVAGGQGTRLGWDAPKGTFPATPVRKTSLFEVFCQFLRKTQQKYDTTVPFYVMTSPINDAPTRAYFEEHDFFGLDPANVTFFPQQMMPAMDRKTGKVLLAGRDALALSPNGHGGSLKALYTSGALADMKQRGIEQISYIQVDNPIVKVVDPMFLGLHDLDRAQMSSKMLPKLSADEKLGNFCVVDGRITVIEYSDLPDELAEQRVDPKDPKSELRFRAGSIALHAIRRDFVESLNESEDGFGLPWHRAEKKVPYLDPKTGKMVSPDKPNAVKLETFVFDALPLCETSIIFEVDRLEEFAPIKNAEGADSPASSSAIQTERAARWLEAKGVKVPRDAEGKVEARIDISPLTAIEPNDLEGVALPDSIERGAEVAL